jgi:hypothetical protein
MWIMLKPSHIARDYHIFCFGIYSEMLMGKVSQVSFRDGDNGASYLIRSIEGITFCMILAQKTSVTNPTTLHSIHAHCETRNEQSDRKTG